MLPTNKPPMAESDIEAGEADRNTRRLEEVHARALTRFDAVAMPQAEMRAQALEARRFVTVRGAQWEGDFGEQFENSPRPQVNRISRSLEKIETDYRENRLTVDYIPAAGNSNSDTADMLDGMHRADSYHFKAQQARDNAFQEGIRGGFGAYRLTTDHTDPNDPQDDTQRVNPGRIIVDADQSVYFDDSCPLYDKSGAKWAFVVVANSRADAEDTWGAGNIADWPMQLFSYSYDWYTPDTVRTAEYYEVELKRDKLYVFTQQDSGEEQRLYDSEVEQEYLDSLEAQGWAGVSRSVKRRRVHKYIVNGTCVLQDCGLIAGDQIPIAPFYFRRDYVDGMERFHGYVEDRMDTQRGLNSAYAKLMELDSLSPRKTPIVADEQMTPVIAEEWARANIDRHAFLRLLPLRNADGSIAAAGPLGYLDPPEVPQVTAALIQMIGAELSSDNDTADQVKANVSAEAMDIAAARVDSRSAIPLDNMRQTVAREGEIYLSMARDTYYEQGREVETLSLDGVDGTAKLAEGYMDSAGNYKIRNDLARGRYKVLADVQQATKTLRQKTVKQSLDLAQISATLAPDLAKAALLTAVMNQDGEGGNDMREFARNMAITIGLTKPSAEEKAKLEEAAGPPKPDAAEEALQAQTKKFLADAEKTVASIKAMEIDMQLKQAQIVKVLSEVQENKAEAELKRQQSSALGGPVQAPDTPSGLEAPEITELPAQPAATPPEQEQEELAPPPIE